MSAYYSFITEDLISNVRKHYKISEKDIKLKVQTIKTWLKSQKHLPDILGGDDSLIEKFLLTNKFDINKTKAKIDFHYMIRGKYEELADADDTLVPSKEFATFLFTKTFSPQFQQIVMAHVIPENKVNVLRFYQSLLLSSEINLRNSYSTGYIYVVNCEAITFDVWRQIGLTRTLRFVKYFFGSSFGRIKNLHFINTPYVVRMILRLLQPFIKAKIFQRFIFHENLESLYKVVPQKLLPKDYGGQQLSINEYLDLQDKLFKENRSLIREIKLQVTNEEMRNR